MTRDEYHWFLQNHVRHRCVMGNDYYATNENLVHADGSIAFRAKSSVTIPSRISITPVTGCR